MSPEHAKVLSKFGLNGEARGYLTKGGELIVPLLPEVLDHFYAIITEDPETARFFPDKALMERAKAGQQRHWEMLLSGEFSEAYFASAYRIGRIHPKIGLPFLFYLSGYANVTSHIQELLLKKYGGLSGAWRYRNLPAIFTALTRAFALDTHIILDAHFAAEREEQEAAFRHLIDGISRMAARDMTAPIPSPKDSDFPERFNPVRESFNGLMQTLRETMVSVQDTANSLHVIANEVAQSAEDLSKRTESQAATLEETAAALEEITVSMRSSAEATAATNRTVSETRIHAEQGTDVVKNAIQKMQEIEESSSRISQIISVIDDIAFQTNLLALNAGVEAARAGESGRGFVVVASEVRSLAQKTTESANEIKTLINVSSAHVESGVALVDETGSALDRMVADIKRTSELTGDAASSAQEQSTGLSEINTGVVQLDQVTQQNAAMVEQTTAAAFSMQQEVSMLAELVGSFQVTRKEKYAAAEDAPKDHARPPELQVVGGKP
ncbi:methyl-accepting chemotaxis protein [Ruegeria profundi]|uniref:methyl-accepting chemotaxis protein n=1 Tax=Ruegeria profundi TaxID=1685378 RepID=UPI001CD1C681|nr:methyl-accepting chemotaxis protein [Ruegeria profundi]MCA0928020.1 methyl-accepting chemotaxis protein [Ruegeria profundi]